MLNCYDADIYEPVYADGVVVLDPAVFYVVIVLVVAGVAVFLVRRKDVLYQRLKVFMCRHRYTKMQSVCAEEE